MELAGGGSISLWTVVAAVQALERSVAAHASRLFSLEHRAGNSEKKHLDCEKMVGEFGNQLESKCAALGTLIQEYGRLQRRLENMENLLKNRNLWILRLPPGVEVPKAPAVALESDAAGFSTQEWENLEEWQRELCGKVLTGKREALVMLDDVISEPALLSRLQGGEVPCSEEEEAASREIPAEPEPLLFELDVSSWDSREAQENQEGRPGLAEPGHADCSIPEPNFAVTVKQEEEEEPYAEEQGAMEGVEFSELGVVPADEVIALKIEQLDTGECSQTSEPATTPPRESEELRVQQELRVQEELHVQGPSEVLPSECHSSPVQQGNWNGSLLVPPAPGEGDLGKRSIVTYVEDSPKKKLHSCSACGKGFCLRKMLTPHSSQCGCEPTGDKESCLQQHQQAPVENGTHTEDGPPVAEDGTHMATRRFKQKQSVTAHGSVDKVDTKPRSTGSVTTSDSFEPRERSHPRGRPYRCNRCQELFSQRKTLIIHRRTHTGHGVLWCSYCGKSFLHPSSLLRHRRIHTGERPYQCSECPTRFTQKEHLLQHEKIHLRQGNGVGTPGVRP